MQDLIDNCLAHHAHYLNIAEAGSSFVNRDFLGARLEPQEIQALLQLYTAGTISQKTLLDQLYEGEVLGDEFDVEEELESTQAGGYIEMAAPEPPAASNIPEESAEPKDTEEIPA
jgi:tRNA U34 5-carboxymethylaminomethyl modifying GTPase MnmE/TrmE